MYSKVFTGGLRGLTSYVASVEVDVNRGLPGFEMVGLLGSEIKEARERIRVALRNTQVNLPSVRITVNISPADIHKSGTVYDLPVALGIMAAWGILPVSALQDLWVAGELGLQGEIKPVRGILPMVMEAQKAGIKECLVPFGNLREGCFVDGIALMGVHSLQETVCYLQASGTQKEQMRQKAYQEMQAQKPNTAAEKVCDFNMIRQLFEAKRAAAVAASGFHHMLLVGPPGAGKTLLARCIPSVLPPLDAAEQREVSAIYSVAGQLGQNDLITRRPFVSPHHTVSSYALAGGGSVPRPGMVSLAHKGVLFLDEMAEFKRATLDILRQPLEEGRIHLAKSGGHFIYPAEFMLVGAANPCPCGFYPDRSRCKCTEYEVHRYFSRISGPLLDRIDICCGVEPVSAGSLWAKTEDREISGSDSAGLLQKVMAARERQKFRFRQRGITVNSRMSPTDTIRFCRLHEAEQRYLEWIADNRRLSARACHRILRVARTIADMEESEEITQLHLSEAVCYRRNEMTDGEVH